MKTILSGAQEVIVATDSEQVMNLVLAHGGMSYLTDIDHDTGTERIGEVADFLEFSKDKIVVNLQCDEPFINPQYISQVACDLDLHENASVNTLACPIVTKEHFLDPNVVKVTVDNKGYAMYLVSL